MSRYGSGRDDDFYDGGRPTRGRDGGGGGGGSDEEGRDRYGAPPPRRTGYDGERGFPGRETFGGDYGPRRDPRAADGRDAYREREYYRDDREAERRDYYDDDRRGNRSLLDEGRQFMREKFGRGRGRGGASRSHVRCRDIMTRDVTVALRETMLVEVARMMRDEDTGVIPVVERAAGTLTDLAETRPDVNRVEPHVAGGGKLVGLITDRDISVRAVAEGKDVRATRAEEIMTTDIHTAQPNDRVIDAIRKMGDKQVRRIPVVDRDGNLRGIISMADVALETEEDRELAEALEEISSGASFWNRIFG